MSHEDPITEALRAWEKEGTEGLEELMRLVYDELKELSRSQLRRERSDHTLNPTALVNEVYLRLLHLKSVSWESRRPFFAFATTLMRRVLVDYARAVDAEKRPDKADRVYLEFIELPDRRSPFEFLELNDALSRIETQDPLLGRIIELRFFGGLSEEEIADTLNISKSTVHRKWRFGKRRLAVLLGQTDKSKDGVHHA
jgi:RNA polymerase sigma-70 factor, ECF subfamily